MLSCNPQTAFSHMCYPFPGGREWCVLQGRWHHLLICLCGTQTERGGRVFGRVEQMWVLTSRSKHFIMVEVSATGRWSFRQVMDDFFGMGMMVACLKQVGTSDRCSEKLNMEVNTSASCSAHALRTRPGTPSGPDDFRGFTLWSSRLTSATFRDRVQSSRSSASLAEGRVLVASNLA